MEILSNDTQKEKAMTTKLQDHILACLKQTCVTRLYIVNFID